MRIRKGDRVVLVKDITQHSEQAKRKGHVARVLSVDPEKQRVIVEGVNYRYRHLRKNQRQSEGGRVEKEQPIHISNVMPYCETCKKGVRVSRKRADDGSATRVCGKCGHTVGSE